MKNKFGKIREKLMLNTREKQLFVLQINNILGKDDVILKMMKDDPTIVKM